MRKFFQAIASGLGAALGAIKDHPWIITAFAFLIVATHWFLVYREVLPSPWDAYEVDSNQAVSIFLGSASASAIVAGFAGVVVVFGLTAQGRKFRELRVNAGRSLGRNWTSSSVSGFVAAGLSLFAALLASLGDFTWSPWLFEWSLLLLIHGTARIIWLLRVLMSAVAQQDIKDAQTENEVPLENEFQ